MKTINLLSLIFLLVLSTTAIAETMEELKPLNAFTIEYDKGPYKIESFESFNIILKMIDNLKTDKMIQIIDGEFFDIGMTEKLGDFPPMDSDVVISQNTAREFQFTGNIPPEVIIKVYDKNLSSFIMETRLIGITRGEDVQFYQKFKVEFKLTDDKVKSSKLLADANLYLKNYDTAKEIYIKLQKTKKLKRDPIIQYRIVVSQLETEDYDIAVKSMDKLLKTKIEKKYIERLVSTLTFKTLKLLSDGKLEQAKKLNDYTKKLQKKRFRKDLVLRTNLQLIDSIILYESGDLKSSYDTYKTTLSLDTYITNYSDFYVHGIILTIKLKKYDESFEYFKKFLSTLNTDIQLQRIRTLFKYFRDNIDTKNSEDMQLLLAYLLNYFRNDYNSAYEIAGSINHNALSPNLREYHNDLLKVSKLKSSWNKYKDINFSSTDKLSLIFFSSYDCSYCKMLKIFTFRDIKVQLAISSLNFIEVLEEESPDLVERYNVIGFPTLLVVDKRGNEIDRKIGFITSGELINFITATITNPTTLQELEQRISNNPSNLEDSKELIKRYWNLLRIDDARKILSTIIQKYPEDIELNLLAYQLSSVKEKGKNIARAFSNNDFKDPELSKQIFTEYIMFLLGSETDTAEVSRITETYLKHYPFSYDEPIFGILVNTLELNGDIEILISLLKSNLHNEESKQLSEYCQFLLTKENGSEILKYFGKLNRYILFDVFTGLENYFNENGYLPEFIEYIGKRPMDPLTFQYLVYKRYRNKINAELTLHEPDKYYLKFWKFSFKGGIEFSSL